jgi:hypothetical protein
MTIGAGVRLRRSRRSLVILAVTIAAATTSTFWLADSGVLALPQAPVPIGAASNGSIATFTALNPSNVTVPHDQGAQKIDGVLLGKVVVAAGFAPQLRVDIAWLDPKDAGAVLHNPNAWMSFGLYYPIHTGTCTGTDPDGAQTLTDGSQFCAALDTQGSGPMTYEGELRLNATMLSGSILERAADPTPTTLCTANTSTWCSPTGSTNQNVFYVAASIETEGDGPPGQQSQLSTLSFYIGAHSF